MLEIDGFENDIFKHDLRKLIRMDAGRNTLKSEFPRYPAQVGSVLVFDRGQVLKDIDLGRIGAAQAQEIVTRARDLGMINDLNFEIWGELWNSTPSA